jgi:hypothetical protein
MLLVLVMFFWPEHCTRTFFSDVPLAIPISPLFLLVQGDIYEPSCEGHVSEAGVDGLEGRNSSIAPTRYQIKWISRKLDAISCTVLHQIVVESIQVAGGFCLFIICSW